MTVNKLNKAKAQELVSNVMGNRARLDTLFDLVNLLIKYDNLMDRTMIVDAIIDFETHSFIRERTTALGHEKSERKKHISFISTEPEPLLEQEEIEISPNCKIQIYAEGVTIYNEVDDVTVDGIHVFNEDLIGIINKTFSINLEEINNE